MSPSVILLVLLAYFGLLVVISYFTSRGADNDSFFTGNRQSRWYLVAFGMIGASLSGVTFISIPGTVGANGFTYMQVVLGYLLGYAVITWVLMPLYYRMDLTTIYGYLDHRFGVTSYKTGAAIFLVSRLLGSTIRLYLVALVLQEFMFKPWCVPFEVSVLVSLALIWVYTFRGGIKTIVWTDTLQTLFMLLAVVLTILAIVSKTGEGLGSAMGRISESDMSRWFVFDDPLAPNHFLKQFFGGAFIAMAMTGLDQDMMQKNLSCRNIGEAQKNMISFSLVLIFVNLFFLFLGALLWDFSAVQEISVERTDLLYPSLSMSGAISYSTGLFFIIGLVAAAYSSADSALTALTTSVCVDFLDIGKKEKEKRERTRKSVHILVTLISYITILIIHYTMDRSAIDLVLTVAGYTYGPLIGLFFFGILTERMTREGLVPIICIGVPIFCYLVSLNSKEWLRGYQFGYEMLGLNGILVFAALWATSKPKV